jgi:hypothetical protein
MNDSVNSQVRLVSTIWSSTGEYEDLKVRDDRDP